MSEFSFYTWQRDCGRIKSQTSPEKTDENKCAAKGYNDLVSVVGMMPDTHVGVSADAGRTVEDRQQIRQAV